jgi:nitrogen fixation-related uncharacterized protein
MTKGQETAQRLVAIVVIMAMLGVMGIPLPIILFFATVVYFVWRAVQRSEQQDIRTIFDFYIAANNILRDEEQRWFGFEVTDVIHRGERILVSMTDPPPLVYFALGALHHRVGDHEAAVEHLAYLLENEHGDESRRFSHSPELQRYVQTLRHIEREPAEAPQTMAAIRSLDRARRTRAASLLVESRLHLGEHAPAMPLAHTSPAHEPKTVAPQLNSARTPAQTPPTPPPIPPPIADVLRDVYEEKEEDHIN